MLVEMIHSKLLVGCGVGGGEAKANDENGRGCGLGLFLRWLLLYRNFSSHVFTSHAQEIFEPRQVREEKLTMAIDRSISYV